MDFKKINYTTISKGLVENLKYRISNLEEEAKDSSLSGFIKSVALYSNAYEDVKSFLSPEEHREYTNKVIEIFNNFSNKKIY